jgi:hypothetical protein
MLSELNVMQILFLLRTSRAFEHGTKNMTRNTWGKKKPGGEWNFKWGGESKSGKSEPYTFLCALTRAIGVGVTFNR